MKAQTTIDPELIALLGRKLYSSHPIPIVVRELIQNSVDACYRTNITPEIALDVDIRYHAKSEKFFTTITCTDNGIGMDMDDLLNKFLCLGGTGKTGERSTQTVGGFGIAKAAIMSGCYWSVHSHDLFVSSRIVNAGLDVANREYIDGTIVKVIIDEAPRYSIDWDVAAMIYGSDIDIHFTYKRERSVGTGAFREVDDPHAGLQQPARLNEQTSGWLGYTLTDGANPLSDLKGYSFFRLNGLVQFCKQKVWNSERKINLIVELTSTALPSTKEFPLSMSREAITNDEINLTSYKWIQSVDENYLSVQRTHHRGDVEDTEKILHGYMLTGTMTVDKQEPQEEETPNERRRREGEERTSMKLALGDMCRQTVKNELDDYIVEDANMPLILLHNYDVEDENFERDIDLMILWSKILEIVVPKDYEFGIGLTNEDFSSAILRHSGVQFFLINPDFFYGKAKTVGGIIMSAYHHAIHESAHIFAESHNERFTQAEGAIVTLTADRFHKKLKKLRKWIQIKN